MLARNRGVVFLAWRELTFARIRFLLMGAVVALISVLVILLSGLSTGLVNDGVSGLQRIPADAFAFAAGTKTDSAFTRSTVSLAQVDTWKAWSGGPRPVRRHSRQLRCSSGRARHAGRCRRRDRGRLKRRPRCGRRAHDRSARHQAHGRGNRAGPADLRTRRHRLHALAVLATDPRWGGCW